MEESQVRRIRIMISSTRADLAQYREEASKVIKKVAEEKEKQVQLVEVSMEKETQSGDREFAVAISKRWVEESDWIVVIVGFNYGTISDEVDADGLSVTEWEYRHARELDKKLYVFIAGEPDSANEYRCSPEERKDLKNWFFRQTQEQAQKLNAFKRELGRSFAEIFANLQVFRERLERTLKNAIDNLPPDIEPGTPLAELIVAVLPNIRDCIRKVALIAACKRVHDHLHELRHHVICPLREEVLSVWKQEGTLSLSRERVIWRRMANRAEAVAGIRAVRPLIGPEHQGLRDSIDAVLQRPSLWDVESDSLETRPAREDFTETLDEFAIDVQEAFSEADRSMAKEESDLRERYLLLLEDLKRARQRKKLGTSDKQRLSDELEKIEANRLRLRNSLTTHHRWQEAHDKLEELDSFRERGEFERKLNHYRGVPLGKLLSLVYEEINRAETCQNSRPAVERTVSTAAVPQPEPQAPCIRHASESFVQDLRYLQESLEAVRDGAGAAIFDKMRKPFDDAFYCVDKRTLSEVERAQELVVKLEDWLDGLAAAQRKEVES